MANLDNIRIGACSVVFKGVNLGHTKGGVTFTFERDFEDLTVDQYGETPVDKALTGSRVMVEINLAEPNADHLNSVVPEGDHVLGSSGERLNLGRDAGYLLRADAGLLVLHPLKNGASDLSEDIQIYKAVSFETVELPFEVDNQRILKATFVGLVDETYASGRRLGHVGPTNVS